MKHIIYSIIIYSLWLWSLSPDTSLNDKLPYGDRSRQPFQVTAANLVSSQTQDVFLTADVMAPLADPEFLSVRAVVAVADTHLYTARVKVDIALGVNFR